MILSRPSGGGPHPLDPFYNYDQVVPFEISGKKSAEILRNATLISYPGFPHGMPTTEAATINKDLLAFLRR